MRSLRRRTTTVRLPPVPSLPDRCLIPVSVHKVYSEISQHFDVVQVGRNESWVLGADTDRGSLRIFLSGEGVVRSLRAVHGGKDITDTVNGDLGMALHLLQVR